MDFLTVKPCKYDAFEVVPKGNLSLDLDECELMLAGKGYEIISNPKVMLVVKKGVEITLYPRGRLLIHPLHEKEEAESVANELYAAIGK
jgi:ArsR family metal-binding transcriptional regulator